MIRCVNVSILRRRFSSPIGESTFSTSSPFRKILHLFCFRPLSGNLLSLQHDNKTVIARARWMFSSPIGESTFSTILDGDGNGIMSYGFRPLSGNLLSLQRRPSQLRNGKCRFRPLSGNLLSLLDIRRR